MSVSDVVLCRYDKKPCDRLSALDSDPECDGVYYLLLDDPKSCRHTITFTPEYYEVELSPPCPRSPWGKKKGKRVVPSP